MTMGMPNTGISTIDAPASLCYCAIHVTETISTMRKPIGGPKALVRSRRGVPPLLELNMATESSGGVQSVERALSLLALLADSDAGYTLSELSRQARLPTTTVHRLLGALVHAGYVTQDAATARYALGGILILIAQKAVRNNALIRVARPWLEQIAAETGETVNLTARFGDSVMQMDHVESRSMLRVSYAPGERFPMHASASGKLFLANLPPAERERILTTTLEPYTTETITRRHTLEREICEIQERGYSLDDAEREMGVRCVAAPIFDSRGEVAAAVSISGPMLRISVNRLHAMAGALLHAAGSISAAWSGAHAESVPQRTAK
jgi:IclR family acetate operon transcriptional repressor